MKIVVCVRFGTDGELGPFDASAYETALQIEGAEITLLSMGALAVRESLLQLTRLGATRAILLSDKAFAAADTLATAKTLACAIRRISPDLVICGRQTLVGDTAQTGPMLSHIAGLSLITNVLSVDQLNDQAITATTRAEGSTCKALPALITVERINTLRLPRLRSKLGEIEVLDRNALDISPNDCGLCGSPTRVMQTFENQSGKRRCKKIDRSELELAVAQGLKRYEERSVGTVTSTERLPHVFCVGHAPVEFAKTVSDDITVIPLTDADDLCATLAQNAPIAVLWGSDDHSKRMAAIVSARMNLGLCADCTRLEAENGELMMYRPALSGSTIAKIKSTTRPAMATVRTASGNQRDVVIGAGFGVKNDLERVYALAEELNAEIVASRKMVDNGILPYPMQLGLTGKSLHPPVYIAIGISGAIHHVAGMQNAGTVIAINPDPDAPIFDYADFGIVDSF